MISVRLLPLAGGAGGAGRGGGGCGGGGGGGGGGVEGVSMDRSRPQLFDQGEPVADHRQRFADAVGRIDDAHHDKHNNPGENAQV